MIRLILAVSISFGLLSGCASNSLPKGVHISPFIMVDGPSSKPVTPAPVKESAPT